MQQRTMMPFLFFTFVLLLSSLLNKFSVSNLTIYRIDDAKRPMKVRALRRGLLFGEWMLLGREGIRQSARSFRVHVTAPSSSIHQGWTVLSFQFIYLQE